MAKKLTAQQLLVEHGLVSDPDIAKRLVMAGKIFYTQKGQKVRVERTSQLFLPSVELFIEEQERFVSRGAYKLLTAIEYFSIDVQGVTALDAGASTGGFTDCLLQYGAEKIYAVDVGKHQLHEKLVGDARVINLEGVNLRTAAASLIPELVDIIVADVSFISLTEVLAPCMRWLKKGGAVAALIKPQFEVGVHQTVKGVVKDEALQKWAVEKILAFAEKELSLHLIGVVPSVLKGPKGNQEYIAYWQSAAN